MRISVQDWLTSRKYGCQLSYAAYHALYAEQEANIKSVVSAYMRYFMSKR
ncbi:hypothetical protein VPSG_00032 [Vibrio phage pYD38-B]|nr:hypothetical protein VPSG_00032 [Vibrio phage pYD38-B]AGN34351.1 hypothetical protein VPSG_00032 [Vibrio phage pYD38-B]